MSKTLEPLLFSIFRPTIPNKRQNQSNYPDKNDENAPITLFVFFFLLKNEIGERSVKS